MGTQYWHEIGGQKRRIGVVPGLGGDVWIVAFEADGGGGRHRVRSPRLEPCSDRRALQHALDAWAEEKGLAPADEADAPPAAGTAPAPAPSVGSVSSVPSVPASAQATAPTAVELVPELPADIEAATVMMIQALGDFKRAALRQAVLVSHAREVLFRGEPGPWLSWCLDTCELSRRYAIMLWHGGDILRKVQHTALLECSVEKLEMLAALDNRKLRTFLAAHDPQEMTREQVREKVKAMQDSGPAVPTAPEAGRKSPAAASPVAKHHRAIAVLSCVDDDDRRLIAAGESPAGCLAAGLCALDIGIAILRDERCWDAEQLRRWQPSLRSAVEVYESLIAQAEA